MSGGGSNTPCLSVTKVTVIECQALYAEIAELRAKLAEAEKRAEEAVVHWSGLYADLLVTAASQEQRLGEAVALLRDAQGWFEERGHVAMAGDIDAFLGKLAGGKQVG
jgi:hypothetical protein